MFRNRESEGGNNDNGPRRGGEGLAKRFVALALAEILCFQSLMGTGVAQALAPTTDQAPSLGQVAEDSVDQRDVEEAQPTDWTTRPQDVSVSVGGLDVDGDALSVDAEQTGELPQQVAATLTLTVAFTGDALAGDTLDLALPEGMSIDAEKLPLDAAIVDASNEDESQVVGEVSSVEGQDGTARLSLSEDVAEAQTVTLRLPVKVDLSVFGDDAAEVSWAPIEDAEEISVSVPSLAELEELAGLGQQDEGADEEAAEPAADSQNMGDASADAAVAPASKVELVTNRNVDAEASFTTLWADNNSDLRPSASDLEASHEYRAYFQVEGDEKYYPLTEADGTTVSDDAKRLLGYTQETLDAARGYEELVRVRRTKTNEYEASTVLLPSSYVTSTQATDEDGNLRWQTDHEGNPVLDADGNKVPVWTSSEHKVSYAVRHEVTERQYLYPDSSGEPRYQVSAQSTYGEKYVKPYERECIQLMEDVTFNLKFKMDTDRNLDAKEWAARWAVLQTLTVTKKGQSEASFTISGQQWADIVSGSGGRFTPEWADADHTTGRISALVPAWHPDGSQLEYSLTQTAEDMDPSDDYEDFFQVWYDNSTAPNHGDDTSALYNGGTLNVTHAGTTHFSAYKRWLDDDAQARPATTYSLWRYSADSGSYATAVEVRVGDANVPVEFTVSAEENAAAGSEAIDLGQKAMDVVRAQGATLAKYDPDGVPYVYVLREDPPSNDYERLNGSDIDQDSGAATGDVSPNYYVSDGSKTQSVDAGFSRADGDKGTYNGGTLINRRSAKTPVSVTKSWNAGAFQDQLRDVVVTFKLQRILRCHAHQDGSVWVSNHDPMYDGDQLIGTYEWNDDIDGQWYSDQVSDWYAEKLTQSLSGSFNRYDKNGEEWVYRWVEVNVEDPILGSLGYFDDFTGESMFFLGLTDSDGNYDTVMFEGGYDHDTGTIVNSYVNVTDQHVDKLWAVVDDEGDVVYDGDDNPIYTQDARPNGKDTPAVTMRVFRDGSLYATATLDGEVEGEPTNLVGDSAAGGTAQETSPWHLDLEGLPKYDDEGREYTYLVLEGDVPGYDSKREYDSDARLTTIRNTPVGEGSGTVVRVSKSWADDGNSTSRKPVKIGIYAGRDIVMRDPWMGSLTAYYKDQLITYVELSAANSWYNEATIPVGGLSYQSGDYYVRELSSDNYDVLTRDAAEESEDADVKRALLNWPENNRANDWNEYCFGKPASDEDDTGKGNFAYRVEYGWNDDLGTIEVTNRRVGSLEIDLSKSWVDQGAGVDARPQASYVISCDEYTNAYVYDAAGWVYVRLGDGTPDYALRDGQGNPIALNRNGVRLENGNLVVPVSRDGDYQAIIDGLPKYDRGGAILHWRVTEQWDGDSGDYQSSLTNVSEDYSSRWHSHDKESYAFTNRRSATKDVTFHMKWYDAYVKEELNQRPDVYLTVYKTVYLYDEDGNPVLGEDGKPTFTTEVVTGYENYKWRPTAEEGKDARYNEYAVIGDLPKYDEHGREIVYYASASTSASSASLSDLDYQSTWFTYSAMDPDPGNRGWDEADSEVSAVDKRVLVGTVTGQGDDGYAVREDGTFNFRIASDLTVRGFKHWMNLPGNFSEADLPELSVYLQRRLAGGSYDGDGTWRAGATVDWSELDVTGDGADYQVKSYLTEGEGVADGQTTVAWAHGLSRVTANRYEFLLSHYGLNALDEQEDPSRVLLPKYDSNGRRYEYRVREIVDGLLPDGTSTVPGGTTAGSDKPGGGVFSTVYGTNSYSISNLYNPSEGRLTVKKLFDGRQEGDKFPSVSFKLYRYYVRNDGTKSNSEQVGTKVLRASDVTTLDGGEKGEGTVTFDGLDIYAPNGQYWVYYVTESGIDGYAPRVGMGDLSLDAPESAWLPVDWFANDCASGDLVQGMTLNEDGMTFSQPTSSAVADDDTVDVTFKNTYDENGLIELNGTKRWYDQSNAFGTRPDGVTLRLVRTYQDGTPDVGCGNAEGEVALQDRDPDGPNYVSWTKLAGSDTWTYVISGLEQYAPDGQPWRYTVSESDAGSGQYSVSGSSKGGTVSAAPDARLPQIVNYLNTKVDVTKTWDDASDPWKQRPDVYVGLQLRYSADDGATWSTWAGAEDALAALGVTDASGNRLTALSGKAFEQLLSDSNNWSFEWNDVPTEALVGGDAYKLEWRAVETALVYNAAAGDASTRVDIAAPDAGGTYGTYQPYQPSQATEETNNYQGDVVFKTTVTNRLDATSISATKSWEDESNKWASRPGTKGSDDAWSVTYALQRTTDDPASADVAWSWVSAYGASVADNEVMDADGNLNALLLTATIGGTSDSASATFDNLPACDPAGNAYGYRLVERVRGSYGVAGGTVLASTADGRVSLVAVPTASADQVFDNVLSSVEVSGHKLWNDFGAGLVPPFSAAPDVRLELQSSLDGGRNWTAVKTAGGVAPQPSWTQNDAFDWTFTYAGLPKTDQAGAAYLYRVREVGHVSNGFVASYADDASVDSSTGDVKSESITNSATRFSLEKLGDGSTGSAGERLVGVTLKVRGASNGKTYAVWTRDVDAEGNLVTRSFVCPKGVSEADDALTDLTPGAGFVEMTGENAGLIIGLSSGAYCVHESRVPAGHLRAADATFTLDWGGSVANLDGATLVTSGNVGYITMIDPVLRGNVELYKYYLHGGSEVALPGMTFDLYRGDATNPDSAVKVASGITMGAPKTDGLGGTYLWTSGPNGAGNDRIAVERDAEGNSVLGKYFQTLADGLPEGSYFLKETGESHLVETSEMTIPFVISANADTTSRPWYEYLKAANAEFNAGVTLAKTDSETGEPIDGATFRLEYRAPQAQAFVPVATGLATGSAYAGNAAGTSFSRTGSSSASGRLELSGLKKGDYRLVEVSDTGYVVDGEDAPTASWTIADADKGQVIDLSGVGDRVEWSGATPAEGSLANQPLHADVILTKSEAGTGDALDSVGFTLQVKDGDDFEDVAFAGTLLTGNTYELSVADDGSIAGVTELVDEGVSGKLVVKNLPWGTYRLTEASALPGYATLRADGSPIASEEFTVQRETFEGSPSGVTIELGSISNSKTDLAIRKTNADGSQSLPGATFTLSGTFASGEGVKTLVTGDDGLAAPATAGDALLGELLVGQTYTLTETVPPDGYGLPDTASMRLEVKEDGSVALLDEGAPAWSASTAGGLTTVTVADAPTKVMVRKVDQSGQPLAGSSFTITGEFSDGSTSKTVSPDGPNATYVSEGLLLAGHTYQVSETVVPIGYVRVPDAQFRVSADGSGIELVGEVAGWSVASDGLTLTAADAPASLVLAKSSADGQALPGATFSVVGPFVVDGAAMTQTREFVTGDDGTVEVCGLVAGADYEVSEKSAPYGYRLSGASLKLHLDEWGSASVVEGGEGFTLVGGTLTLSDSPISLGFRKTDGEGNELSGALFDITGIFADASGVLLNGGEPVTYHGYGVDALSGLHFVQGQTYTLSEFHAPDGFKLVSSDVTLDVAEDGSVTADVSAIQNGNVTVGEDGVTVTVADEPIDVSFAKTGENGEPLAGATFVIRPHDGSAFADGSSELTVTTDSTGAARLSGLLVAGRTYEVEETVAPEGCKRLDGTILVTVNSDGTLSAVDPQPEVSNGTVSVGGANGSTLSVADEAVPFSIVKYGADSDGRIDTTKPLSGARFSVTGTFAGEKGEFTIELVTGEDGTAGSELTGRLVVGRRYVIREVEAPAGYVQIQDALEVLVNDDGSLSAVGNAPAEFQLRRNGSLLVFAGGVLNDPSRLEVVKTSSKNSLTRLAGATFQITPAAGSSFAREVEGGFLEATTWGDSEALRNDYAGWAEFDRGALRADGSSVYVLRETHAPAGYELNANELHFKLMTDGSVVLLASADPDDLLDVDAAAELGFAVTGDGGFVVSATDEPVEVSLAKRGEDGQALAGAAFTLSCADGTNEAGEPNHFAGGSTDDVLELVTDSDGNARMPSAALVAGNSYVLEETVAPAGHVLDAEPLTFTVNADGTVTVTEGPDSYEVTNDAQVTITMTDAPTRLALRKQSSDGTDAAAMAGATFEVTPEEGYAFSDGSTDARRFTIGDDGSDLELVGLLNVDSIYQVREFVPPAGYALVPDAACIAVRQDGTVVPAEDQLPAGWGLSSEGGLALLAVTDDPVMLTLAKSSTDGALLPGATLQVTGPFVVDGSVSQSTRVLVTGDDGTVGLDGAVAGADYVVSEVTAPNGFKLSAGTATIHFDEFGNPTLVVGGSTGFSLEGSVLTIADEPVSLAFAKADEDGNALDGALFSITGVFADGNGRLANGGEAVTYDSLDTTGLSGLHFVQGQTYELEETCAPVGFKLISGKLSFSVDADGRAALDLSGVSSGSYALSGDGVTITAIDEPIRLSFAKTDGAGRMLDGALFSVTGVFADGRGRLLNDGRPVTREGLDVAALGELNYVQGETYALEETQAPAGYELIAGQMTFAVAEDGVVTLDCSGVNNGGYSVSADGAAITASDQPIEVLLTKSGEKGQPLAGATFAIRPHDGGTFADGSRELMFTTDLDGRASTSALLVAGKTYELEEAQAPEGYKLLSGIILVTVNADGTLSPSDSQAGLSNGTAKVVADAIEVSDDPVPFSITKCGPDSDGRIDPDLPLAGARFSVTGTFAGESGERTVELVTGQDGMTGLELAGRLVVGRTYVIRETQAPDGYVLVQGSLEVLVNEDGTLSPVGDVPVEYQLSDKGGLLSFAGGVLNNPSRLEVMKASSANPLVKLAGATFEVAPAEGSSFAHESAGGSLEATTQAGWAEFDRGALRADGSSVYVLRETQAPAGYELNANELHFKLATDGSVVLLGSNDPDDLLDADAAAELGFAVTGDGGFVVSATDEPVEVSLVKRGEDGTALAGAAFTLSCADGTNVAGEPNHFADGSADDVHELTTGADGTASVESGLLVAGNSYVLQETVAPAGYVLDPTPLTFKVAPDGTIVATDGSESFEVSNEGQVIIAMTDAPTRLALRKQASDGADAAAMAGATFQVTPEEGYAFSDGSTEARLLEVGQDGLTSELVGVLDTDSLYTVREVQAPAGYSLVQDPCTIAVRQDGTVVAATDDGNLPTGWALAEADARLTLAATDRPVVMSLVKADGDGRPLAGAAFSIRPHDGGTFADGSSELVVTTDEQGRAMLSALLLAGRTYEVEETRAPEGYKRISGTILVTVADDGSIRPVDPQCSVENGAIEVGGTDGSTLTVSDEATLFLLRKVDQDGNALPGASFTVSGEFSDGTVEKTFSPAGSDASCAIEGALVAGREYRVSETGIPAGYSRVPDATFRVSDDGTTISLTAAAGGWSVSPDGLTLTASDAPIRLSFSKTDDEGNAIDGAMFSITGVFADGEGNLLNGGEPLGYHGLSTEELSELRFVQGQQYVLSEDSAPAGYKVLSGEARLYVSEDGTVEVDASGIANGTVVVGEDGVSVTVSDQPIEVTLTKVGENGEPLAGATFSVRPNDGGTFADGSEEIEVTTDEAGRAQLSALLVAGATYEVEETQAPEGRKLLSGTILVKVGEDGTLSAVEPQPEVSNGGFSISDGGLVLAVTNEAVPFSITKVGTDDDGNADPGVRLAGARFSVTGTFAGDESESTVELVTGEDGKAGSELEGRLVVGRTYVIREVEAPAGYTLVDGTLEVEVNADGSLSPVGDVPIEYQLSGEGGPLVFTGDVLNRPSRLQVVKASSANSLQRLDGAEFRIVPAEGSSFAREVEGGELSATTSSGWAEFDRGALRADGSSVYVLSETQAPAGYELNANGLHFKLATDGSVVLLASADPDDALDAAAAAELGFAVTGDGGFVVSATDEPIEASLVKVSAAGGVTPLAGAAFTLSCADGTNEAGEPNHFANGSTSDVYELVTGEDGTVQVPSATLVAGNSYELEETVAPAGYALASGALTFRVAADGAIELLDGPEAFEPLADGRVGVRVADEPTHLTVAKAASDGAPASAMVGAVFEVEPAEGFAFADGTKAALRLEAGSDGLAPELEGVLDAGAVYVVREVEAPAGYALLAGEARIAVRQDGSVVAATDDGRLPAGWSLAEADGHVTLTATDEPLPEPAPEAPGEPKAPGESQRPTPPSGSGAAPFTGDVTSSAVASLMLAGGLALVASGLRRRRRHG